MVRIDDAAAWEAWSDAELLAASAGTPDAFGIFYERHARVVLAFFYRRTACAQTSADLTGETFAVAFASRARYRDTGAPARAWLLGIARHQLLRSFRRSHVPDRARRRLGIERIAVEELSYERIETLADMAPLRDALNESMATLTPKLADAVRLRIGLDLPYCDVAHRLGTTEGAARARVARGLSQLIDNLAMA